MKHIRWSRSPRLAELEAAIDADRKEHGKAPLPASKTPAETREIKVSRTDPDSGFMTREGKPQGFFYLDHRTVDGKHAIITDTFVTPGNVHDSQPYLARLDRQIERFGLPPPLAWMRATTRRMCAKVW